MFKTYWKIAFRNILSNRMASSINITGLALGMATALLIFVWVQNELTFDNYHTDIDRRYRINSHIDAGESTWNWGLVPYNLTKEAKTSIPEIEALTTILPPYNGVHIRRANGHLFQEKDFVYVDENWFKEMTYKAIGGSMETFFKQKSNIAVTRDWAEKHYGRSAVLGETLQIDSFEYTISLVLENNPSNSSFQFKVIAPLASYPELESNGGWGNFNFIAFAKIAEQASHPKIAEKLEAIIAKNVENNNASFSLESLQDIRFSTIGLNNFKSQNKTTIYIFALIGLIILLVAGFNFINLSTAQINKRVKEISVKKIIGAKFQHIFIQILIETALISCLSLLFAIGIAQFFLPALNTIIDLPLEIDLSNPQIWLGMGAIVLLSVLVAGIYPAILLANFQPVKLIKGVNFSGNNISLRKVLVVAQFAIAIITLISTIIIYQQLKFIQNKEVGYDRDHIISFKPSLYTGDEEKNFNQFGLFKEALQAMPEFEAIAITSSPLVNIQSSNTGGFKWEGKDPNYKATVTVFRADEKLQNIFKLKLVAGKWFEEGHSANKDGIILNETALRKFNLPASIVGSTVTFRRKEKQVIGVVKDFHFKNLQKAIEPLLISYNNGGESTILAKVNSKNIATALNKAEEKFSNILTDTPFKYQFMDDTFNKMHEREAKMTLLFQIFAGLLIFISCLGLFGLATFAVERRTKEIGIRKVLGANVHLIVQLLSKDFIKLVLIALIVAIPISWYLTRTWLENYAYRVEIQWWMFAFAGILTLGLALMTVSLQSVRAALANPVDSLRNE